MHIQMERDMVYPSFMHLYKYQNLQPFPSILMLMDMGKVGKSVYGDWLQTVKLNCYVHCIAIIYVIQHWQIITETENLRKKSKSLSRRRKCMKCSRNKFLTNNTVTAASHKGDEFNTLERRGTTDIKHKQAGVHIPPSCSKFIIPCIIYSHRNMSIY